MKESDEILQELIEQGKHEGQDVESKAYRIVFQALKKEPKIPYAYSLASVVINRITQLKEQRATRKDFIWLGVGVLVFIIAAIISVVLTNFKFSFGAFNFLNNYGSLLIFAAVLIVVLHWVEKRILHRKTV